MFKAMPLIMFKGLPSSIFYFTLCRIKQPLIDTSPYIATSMSKLDTIIQAQGCTSSNKSDDQQCSAPPHQQFSVSLLIGFYLSSLRSQQSTFSIFDLHFISKFLNNGYNNVMPRRNVSRHSAKTLLKL